MKKVREICDKHKTLLIIDEIQTGMGRTGNLFAFQHEKIMPDMILVAKGIASGFPMGVVIMNERVNDTLYAGCHTNTFGGNPFVCAVANETLNILEEDDLINKAKILGTYFVDKLKACKMPVVREIRGEGLMIGIDLKVRCGKYAKKLQEHGIIVLPTFTTVLRLLPPLIISKEDIDYAVKIIYDCLI